MAFRIHVHGPDLRVHVVADVLRRAATRRYRPVLIGHSGPSPSHPLDELNVQPMNWDPGEADVHVSATAVPGRCLLVAPAPTLSTDPLAFRLALLRTHYSHPPDLSGSEAHLNRWRHLVAEWANSPGKPMCVEYITEAQAALDDDLDTATVFATMDRLAADPKIPPGSKFESFVHLDLILGLNLVATIGRSLLPPVAPRDLLN